MKVWEVIVLTNYEGVDIKFNFFVSAETAYIALDIVRYDGFENERITTDSILNIWVGEDEERSKLHKSKSSMILSQQSVTIGGDKS
jgi:hypothetical protein